MRKNFKFYFTFGWREKFYAKSREKYQFLLVWKRNEKLKEAKQSEKIANLFQFSLMQKIDAKSEKKRSFFVTSTSETHTEQVSFRFGLLGSEK